MRQCVLCWLLASDTAITGTSIILIRDQLEEGENGLNSYASYLDRIWLFYENRVTLYFFQTSYFYVTMKLRFYWYQGRGIVCVAAIVSFSNHRPHLKRYRVSPIRPTASIVISVTGIDFFVSFLFHSPITGHVWKGSLRITGGLEILECNDAGLGYRNPTL